MARRGYATTKRSAKASKLTGSPPTPTPTCHLLKLPAELRNHIYELVVVSEKDIEIGLRKHQLIHPSIINSCRQIRAETGPMFYSKNRFYIRYCTNRAERKLNTARCGLPSSAVKFLTNLHFSICEGGCGYTLCVSKGSPYSRIERVKGEDLLPVEDGCATDTRVRKAINMLERVPRTREFSAGLRYADLERLFDVLVLRKDYNLQE